MTTPGSPSRSPETELPLGIGTAAVFVQKYGDYLVGVHYAVVGFNDTDFFIVPIDHASLGKAGQLRLLPKTHWAEHRAQGRARVVPLPTIPGFDLTDDALKCLDKLRYKKQKKSIVDHRDALSARIAPLIAAADDIFSADDVVKRCNSIARANGLNVTRARLAFFTHLAYNCDSNSCLPRFDRIGVGRSGTIKSMFFEEQKEKETGPNVSETPRTVTPPRTRGRAVKDAAITPLGWDFQKWWAKLIRRGWRKHAKNGHPYKKVWIKTLCHEFHCQQDKTTGLIFHPRGGTFPSEKQFATAVVAWIGKDAWKAAKYGEQTLRNRSGRSLKKAVQWTVNLLEELHWDAQLLPELPADPLDPTQPGMSIVRVQVSETRCGGAVGTGYSYAHESHVAYLIALLSMAMRKADFAELWGVDDITNAEWPAVGISGGGALRGDRGASIARSVQSVVSGVLHIAQEWAASYDPVGKAMAEANHWRTTHVDGKPEQPKMFRPAIDIIRDDLRKTRTQFLTSLKADRLEDEQALRGVLPTAAGIWNDLMERGLYAGQHVPFEKIARLTLCKVTVSITDEGAIYEGQRYLSQELEDTGLLELAIGKSFDADAFALPMSLGRLWLDFEGKLIEIEAVPVSFNTLGSGYKLTRQDALVVVQKRRDARRRVQKQRDGYILGDEAARTRDAARSAEDLAAIGEEPSTGAVETHQTLKKLLSHGR